MERCERWGAEGAAAGGGGWGVWSLRSGWSYAVGGGQARLDDSVVLGGAVSV